MPEIEDKELTRLRGIEKEFEKVSPQCNQLKQLTEQAVNFLKTDKAFVTEAERINLVLALEHTLRQ